MRATGSKFKIAFTIVFFAVRLQQLQSAQERPTKPLPINIESFSTMINRGYIYVDKTHFICRLLTSGEKFLHLSRPKRFGKSLLLNTLEELFQNNEKLFEDTAIYKNCDCYHHNWTAYPMIKMDFSKIAHSSAEEFGNSALSVLEQIASSYDIFNLGAGDTLSIYLGNLIRALHKKFSKRVVVLIDQYDHGYLQNFHNHDIAEEFLKILEESYLSIKEESEHVHFYFTTGVTTISKCFGVDISDHPNYAYIAGFTEEEVDANFGVHMEAIAQSRNLTKNNIRNEIRLWYHGHSFPNRQEMPVYNPYSIIRYLQTMETLDFWTSGSNSPFSKLLANYIDKNVAEAFSYLQPNRSHFASEDGIRSGLDKSSPDNSTRFKKFMFQSGYFKAKFNPQMQKYNLTFANREVEEAFHQQLADYLGHGTDPRKLLDIASSVKEDIKKLDMDNFTDKMNAFISMMPIPRELDELRQVKEKITNFRLNFYNVLELAQMFDSKLIVVPPNEITPNESLIIGCDESSKNKFYIFELTTDYAVDPVERCVELEKYKPWDELLRKNWPTYVIEVCVGFKFEAESRKIVDWGVVRFQEGKGEVERIYHHHVAPSRLLRELISQRSSFNF